MVQDTLADERPSAAGGFVEDDDLAVEDELSLQLGELGEPVGDRGDRTDIRL
jgi:hypothetical protein